MRRARMQAAGFGALLVSLLLAGAGVATAAGWLGSDTPPPRTRTVHITIHFSAFDPSDIEIQPGQTIRFVVENTDPIDHEFIVGDEGVQQAHEAGTEAHHPPRPGEISDPARRDRGHDDDVPLAGQPAVRLSPARSLRLWHAGPDQHRVGTSRDLSTSVLRVRRQGGAAFRPTRSDSDKEVSMSGRIKAHLSTWWIAHPRTCSPIWRTSTRTRSGRRRRTASRTWTVRCNSAPRSRRTDGSPRTPTIAMTSR